MAKIIVTTCGTSLYQSSCWSYNNLNETPLSTITGSIEYLQKQIECESAIKKGDASTLAESFDIVSWDNKRLKDMPAELASLYVLKDALSMVGMPLHTEDKIILLYSDNEEGKFCAKIIEQVLFKKLNRQISCVIIPKETQGLDPESATTFAHALKGVWTEYNTMIENLNDNILILNLTGGYKATSMVLTGLAAIKVGKVKIVYLHETATQQSDQLLCIYFKNNAGAAEKLEVGLGTKDKNYSEIAAALTV